MNLDKFFAVIMRWKRPVQLYPFFFFFLGLSIFQGNVLAVENIPNLVWQAGTAYNNFGGCGFITNYKGMSPKVIADNECADRQRHQACNPAFFGTGYFAPSIFVGVDLPSTTDPNYRYRYVCTGTYPNSVFGVSSVPIIADNPKNLGRSCPEIRNPVNPMNGNKYQNEIVYDGVGTLSNLRFDIAYNSVSDTDKKMLGISWRSSYDRFISNDIFAYTGLLAMRREDGFGFGLQNIGGTITASSDKTYSLTQQTDGQGATTGWTFINERSGETELYDANGKLLSITDRAGLTHTLNYSVATTPAVIAPAPGLLIQVTDHVGRSLNFTYDASKRVTKMMDPSGANYSFTYNPNNLDLLRTVTYSDGTTKTFHYGSEASETIYAPILSNGTNLNTRSLTGITDENGNRFATWMYDNRARAISSEHASGVEKSTLIYNPYGSLPTRTIVTDTGTGAARTYNFTTILGVVKSTGQSQPAGSGCAASASAITYDVNGNVASRTDFNRNMTTYSYDMARNLEIRRTEGLNTAGNATSATRTITTTWHPTWRLPLVMSEFSGATATGTALRITTNVYDAKGNLTSITEADPVRSLTRITTITYTYSSLVPGLVITKVVNGPRTDATDTTTYNYYDADATCTPSSAAPLIDPITNTSPPNLGCRGQLQSMTNALGQTTTYDRYNHHGQVEQMTDANGLVTTNTYDLRQRLLSRTVGTQTTSLTYDNAGQVIQLTLPDNSQLNYTYDAAHRLTEVQDTLSNKVTYTLDTEGNRINEVTTDPLGGLAKTITRSYDALNRLQQVTGVE